MKSCDACGLTEFEALAGAKTIGLLEEFRCGVYTCCQISAWADEQSLAWFEALVADGQHGEERLGAVDQPEDEPVLVPVHLRRAVPWYRRP